MSGVTYLVSGAASVDEARKVAEAAYLADTAHVPLAPLVEKIAAALVAKRDAHEAAVRKARAVDAAKLDRVADTLAEIKTDLEDASTVRRDVATLVKRMRAGAEALSQRTGTTARAPRRIYS